MTPCDWLDIIKSHQFCWLRESKYGTFSPQFKCEPLFDIYMSASPTNVCIILPIDENHQFANRRRYIG